MKNPLSHPDLSEFCQVVWLHLSVGNFFGMRSILCVLWTGILANELFPAGTPRKKRQTKRTPTVFHSVDQKQTVFGFHLILEGTISNHFVSIVFVHDFGQN